MTSDSQVPPSSVEVGTFTPATAGRVLLRRTRPVYLHHRAFSTIAYRGSAVTQYPAGITVVMPSLRVLTSRHLPRYFPL